MKNLKDAIDKYIDDHSPQGLEKLAVRCGVSRTTIESARAGKMPKRDRTIGRICDGLGLSKKIFVLEEAS